MRNGIYSRKFALKGLGSGIISAIGTSSGVAIGQSLTRRTPNVRRSINDPVQGPQVAVLYREAVQRLKNLPETDPRSWKNLAQIHINYCPHGNWYFLPWHRAYLSAFEAICQEILEEPTFALPYWNWTTDRQLPSAFSSNNNNALYDPSRLMGPNDTLSSRYSNAERIFGQSSIETILLEPNFEAFASFRPTGQMDADTAIRWQTARGTKAALERGPHDYGHGIVGGNMGNATTSPLDPIFYLHHANLDRLWVEWNSRGGNNSSTVAWAGFTFVDNFPTPDGASTTSFSVNELIETINLGYWYDSVRTAPQISTAVPATVISALASTELRTLIKTDEVTAASLGIQEIQLPKTGATEVPKLFAFINDVQVPEEREVEVRVFLNCDYLTALTPLDDPHFVGTFTFFMRSDHHELQSVALDISDTVAKLRELGALGSNQIDVQLLPLRFVSNEEEAQFNVGSIELVVLET